MAASQRAPLETAVATVPAREGSWAQFVTSVSRVTHTPTIHAKLGQVDNSPYATQRRTRLSASTTSRQVIAGGLGGFLFDYIYTGPFLLMACLNFLVLLVAVYTWVSRKKNNLE